jgi:hypothetical protein
MKDADRFWNYAVVLTELTRQRLQMPETVHAYRLDTMVCRVCDRTAEAIESQPSTPQPVDYTYASPAHIAGVAYRG